MAHLSAFPAQGDWPRPGERKYAERHENSLGRLWREHLDAVTHNRLVGRILRFARGPRWALYRVASTHPFVLEHIPYLGGETTDDETLRGVRITDVTEQTKWTERLLQIWADAGFKEA